MEENKKNNSVTYKLGHEVTSVVSRSKKGGVVLEYHASEPSASMDGELVTESFDELVMACGSSVFSLVIHGSPRH